MKITGFRIIFNPKRTLDFFVNILVMIGKIYCLLSIPVIILITRIFDSPEKFIEWAHPGVVHNPYGIFILTFYSILLLLGGALFLYWVILKIVDAVIWINKHGDKNIEVDLTNIKLNRKSKYKELP